MKPWLVALAAIATVAAIVFAALYFTAEPATKTVLVKPCGDRVFGRINTLVRKGGHFELRFDPAWFTSGVTANTAAAEDGVIEPGQPMPNDNYIVDESHRLYTYLVPANTRVTVLTNNGTGILSTPITVSELARLVRGEKPIKLFEGLDTGFWMRVHVDTACALDQQYHP